MNHKLVIGPPPHFYSGASTRRIMLDVIIALLPAIIASIIIFGQRALIVTLVTVISCVLGEYISRRLMGLENTLDDLSAVVTGILLSLCLPVSIPFYIAAFGGLIATVIIKQMFGGLGQNFVNPALGARIALMVSFPAEMTNWQSAAFTASSATPLAAMKELIINPGATVALPTIKDLFLGLHTGCLGEVSVLALLLGAVYLILRKIITPTIPLSFIATVFLLSWVLGVNPIYQIFSGGLALGAFFMATDYVTSPIF